MIEKQERRLAAIMFTDMVGYTALMQEDEEQARRAQVKHRKALETAITVHQGELLQYFGDGSLSIFPSAVAAVTASIEVQQALLAGEAVSVRIGIHQGDIAFDEQGVYGDAVNVASRIESLAVAGSVLISGTVADEIKNQPSLSAAGLGEFRLKNVKQPTRVFAVEADQLEVPTRQEVTSHLGVGRKGKLWSRPAVLMLSAVVTLFVTLAILQLTRMASAGGVPDRVAVAIFNNRTGDPSLDRLGVIAADWVSQGLVETGLARVVPTTIALYSSYEPRVEGPLHSSLAAALSLSERTEAAILVTGAYYVDGDTLLFRANVIDPASDEVLHAVAPTRAALREPFQAVDTLRDRIMVAVATILDTRVGGTATVASQPPTFEAYEEYVTGLELLIIHNDTAGAAHLFRANQIDSTYTLPLLVAAFFQYGPLSESGRIDSLIAVVAAQRNRLPAYDHLLLEWLEVPRRPHSPEEVLEAGRRVIDLAPDPLFVAMHAFDATSYNRPLIALDALSRLDPKLNYMRGWTAALATDGHHVLGDHHRELEEARGARTLYPQTGDILELEIRALAALGRTEEVRDRIAEPVVFDVDQLALLHPFLYDLDGESVSRVVRTLGRAKLIKVAALELYAHDQAHGAREILEEAIRWYETLPEVRSPAKLSFLDVMGEATPEERAVVAVRSHFGETLYWAEEWDAAEVVFRQLEVPPLSEDVVDCRLNTARVAARRGDAERAIEMTECFSRAGGIWFPVSREIWQARMSALLGQADEAVDHVRTSVAHENGVPDIIGLHRDFDLLTLHDYPPFKELLQPNR